MNKKIALFLSREDVNTGRQLNVDYAKTMSIFFMILVHVMMHPYYYDLETGFGAIVYSHLGDYLSAPLFVISMGLGLAYTRFPDSKSIIKRGIKLLILAYVLNIARNILPAIFSLVKCNFNGFDEEVVTWFLIGDILQFAGLALITFGLLKKTKLSPLSIFTISLIINLVITFVPNIYTESRFVGQFIGLLTPIFYYGEIQACFPLLTWYVFVAFDYLFGLVIRKIKNLDKFYLYSLIIGIVLYLIFFNIEQITKYTYTKAGYDYAEYYNTIIVALYSIGSTMTVYSIFYFLNKFTPKFLNEFCYKTSAAINEIYIISWIIIRNVFFVYFGCIYPDTYPLWIYLVSSFIITVVSIILGWKWREYKQNKRNSIVS